MSMARFPSRPWLRLSAARAHRTGGPGPLPGSCPTVVPAAVLRAEHSLGLGDRMADLVIAEGVELELRPARLASRFMAVLLDFLVQGAIFSILLFTVLALNSGSG